MLDKVSTLACAFLATDSVDAFTWVEKFGVFAALVLFFVWSSWKREKDLVERLRSVEGQHLKLLTRITKSNERLGKLLSLRPCLRDGEDIFEESDESDLDKKDHE